MRGPTERQHPVYFGVCSCHSVLEIQKVVRESLGQQEQIFCHEFSVMHFYLFMYIRKFARILCDKAFAEKRFYVAKKNCHT